MTQQAKIAMLTGLNIVFGGVAASSVTAYVDATLNQQEPTRAMDVLQSNAREFEASFLKVSASCKVSHAAFDEIAVAIQEIPAEVRAIHAEVENA